MSEGLVVGATLPDFVLPDENGVRHRLSTLQGDDVMVLMLGRGEHCPRERMHQREMLRVWEWCQVAWTRMVTVVPGELHDVYKLKLSTGATWPYLSDEGLQVQRRLAIDEYTDTHHAATVPHTLVLSPGLVIEKVYVGYWYWGRPSAERLWADLGEVFARTKPDFDPTTPEARAAWEAVPA